MTFFCPHCHAPMEQTGQSDRMVCLSCRCIFEVRVEIREVFHGSADVGDIRKLGSPADRIDSDGF